MEILQAIKNNNNFHIYENMLYSKTGIEICYLGEGRDLNDNYSFYETGCRNTYQTENIKMISYYINEGKRLITLKETRSLYFDKTILLPVKNGVFVSFVNEEQTPIYAFKSIYGKKYTSTNSQEVINFIKNYNDACEQVF